MSQVKLQSKAPAYDFDRPSVKQAASTPRGQHVRSGLSPKQLKWLPLVVPLAAVMMALCAAAILSYS